MTRLTVKAGAVAAAFVLAACSSSAQQTKTISETKSPSPNDVVATVGGASIRLEEVDERALEQTANTFGTLKLSQALYEARRAAIDDIVGDRLLEQEAKARGVDKAKLTDDEINTKIAPVTDADVTAWYQANPSRVQGASLEQVSGPIKSLLIQERAQEAYKTYVDRLKTKTAVRILLDPPRQKIARADSPTKEPVDAPIELIEFSDFQCPFCLRAHPIVNRVLSTYGDRIHFVYRNFPLPNHPNARPAAEAAQCAAEQGKFWEYHDRLFGDPSKLSEADLKHTAAELGLDSSRFDACVDSRKYQAKVDADIRAGSDAGVSGTPSFFINGRMLTGAQPFEAFKDVIDDELQRRR
jgi:protein-disulfide isomerase